MIATRFTEKFGTQLPIINAPMAYVADGYLANSVISAGGFGLLGGGYGDESIIADGHERFRGQTYPLGIGFITWALEQNPALLQRTFAAEHAPSAVLLSFGDPSPFSEHIQDRCSLWVQVSTMAELKRGAQCGATVIIAQNAEGGGHGADSRYSRGAFSFITEARLWLDQKYPDVILGAAGGISHGSQIVGALALGADVVMIGTCLWATKNQTVPLRHAEHAIQADGDRTRRSRVFDYGRGLDWPDSYSFRALHNSFWEQYEESAATGVSNEDRALMYRSYQDSQRDDYNIRCTPVGESIGCIDSVETPREVIVTLRRQMLTAYGRLHQLFAQ